MKYTAINPVTGGPLPSDDDNRHLDHKYLPRIRCLDCPGKLYIPGPGMTAENFEAHLKNRGHRNNVEKRLDGALRHKQVTPGEQCRNKV